MSPLPQEAEKLLAVEPGPVRRRAGSNRPRSSAAKTAADEADTVAGSAKADRRRLRRESRGTRPAEGRRRCSGGGSQGEGDTGRAAIPSRSERRRPSWRRRSICSPRSPSRMSPLAASLRAMPCAGAFAICCGPRSPTTMHGRRWCAERSPKSSRRWGSRRTRGWLPAPPKQQKAKSGPSRAEPAESEAARTQACARREARTAPKRRLEDAAKAAREADRELKAAERAVAAIQAKLGRDG